MCVVADTLASLGAAFPIHRSFNSGYTGTVGAYSTRDAHSVRSASTRGDLYPATTPAVAVGGGLSHAHSGTSFGSRTVGSRQPSALGGAAAASAMGQTRSVNTAHTQR